MTNEKTTIHEKDLLSMMDSLRLEQNSRLVSQSAEDARSCVVDRFEKLCEDRDKRNAFENMVDDVINYTYDDGFEDGFRAGVQLLRTLMTL